MPTQTVFDRAIRPHGSRLRSARRGTVLVVVLGILVVLALIAIAFSFIVQAEYESSLNALTRFRALSAARDGEAYAVGRLRAIAASQHYEPEGSWSFNTRFADTDARGRTGPSAQQRESYEEYLRRYARNPRLSGENPSVIVSFARSNSTSDKPSEDDNWVDLNGDGRVSQDELTLATDIINRGREGIRGVSYFVGDGVDLSIKRGSATGGTFRELGDRARLKVIDTNSQFPVNSFEGDELSWRLQILGHEIEKIAADRVNPFPPDVANDIARFKEESFGRIGTKDALLNFMMRTRASPQTMEFTLDMVTVRSWPDDDGAVNGTVPVFGPRRFSDPQKPMDPKRRADWEEQRRNAADPNNPNRRATHQDWLGAGEHTNDAKDGFPHIEPGGARERRSPMNINTVQLPVLVAMLAGIEAEPRYLYYPNTDRVVQEDAWLQILGFFDGKRLSDRHSTTDAGRQVNYGGDTSAPLTRDPSIPNTATYQIVTVGPLSHEIEPGWKGAGNAASAVTNPWRKGNHAYNIARRIIAERERSGPFRSWMDFDYRICHRILLGFGDNTDNMKNSADLVRAGRGSIGENVNLGEMPKGDGSGESHLLPDPAGVRHPVSGNNDSAKHSYTPAEFDAWYWRACVDMIRCNFNPNGYYNKSNPEAAAYTVVDSTDMRVQTNPMCFSSMGTYEVVSQGEITARRIGKSATGTSSGDNLRLDYPVARRTFRSIVEVYRTLEHTTQSDFTRSPDRNSFRAARSPGGTAATGGDRVDQIEAPVALTAYGTISYPHSVDLGTYAFSDQTYLSKFGRSGTANGLKGRDGASAIAEPLRGGYYSTATADSRFGHVALYPQDRSPNKATESNPEGLNFWGQYNISLEARREGKAAQVGNLSPDGHVPYSVNRGKGSGGDTKMSRSWNSAYPDPNRLDWREEGWMGFEAHSRRGNADAARHANLRPDGVRMSSWSYSPAFGDDAGSGINPNVTYTAQDRIVSRLALLCYRSGQNSPTDLPFAPIAGLNPDPLTEDVHGDDFYQHIVRRLTGANLPFPPTSPGRQGKNQGTDRHNVALQGARQQMTNFPYYEGWIDFWIKWELPPQGKSGSTACAGEIDPGSGNFSGLLGSTSYGRFEPTLTPSTTRGDGNGVDRNSLSQNNDFEGAQFFLFKEPGGRIRATHIYFNRAYTVPQSGWTASAGAIGAVVQGAAIVIGNNARIHGRQDGITNPDGTVSMVPDRYQATNDIASGRGPDNDQPLDLGFSYARNESYFDLNAQNNREHLLVTHNWYRFSLKYRSNSRDPGIVDPSRAEPHELYIDGRKVQRLGPALPAPLGSLDAVNTRGVNTGEITNENGILVNADFDPPGPGLAPPPFIPQRSATLLGEVDPGDKLTIGCVYRQSVVEDAATAGGGQPSTRLFRFEENMVAPANATMDDVRIYRSLVGATGFTGVISESDYAAFSRYQRNGGPNTNGEFHERGMYENGFVALQTSSGRTTPYTYPIRVGSLMWTEARPVWDPYRKERFDLSAQSWANAPQVQMCYEVFPDIEQVVPDGNIAANDLGAMNSTDRNSLNYWLNGGVALSRHQALGRPVYLMNDFSSRGSGKHAFFKYQAWFVTSGSGTRISVLNTTPILDDVRITLLTPPRRLYSEEIMQ